MKKIIISLAGVIILTSCGSTGSGALTGAMFGSVIGSAIGGIGGGPRGSDVGTLIGMATGAATGAAIGSANEEAQRKGHQRSTYQNEAPAAGIEYSDDNNSFVNAIEITNVRFINNNNATHIAKGETVKVSFEVHNTTNDAIYNIVPRIQETTNNRHLDISPSTMIETLDAKKAIRYTAYIVADNTLRSGTAHFVINTISTNNSIIISNTVEFDVPLN